MHRLLGLHVADVIWTSGGNPGLGPGRSPVPCGAGQGFVGMVDPAG